MTPIDPDYLSSQFDGGDGLTVHQRLAARFTAALLTGPEGDQLSADTAARQGIDQADAFIEVYNERAAKANPS